MNSHYFPKELVAFLSSQECHQKQAALLSVSTQDDTVNVVSACGEVFRCLVATTLTLDVGAVVE